MAGAPRLLSGFGGSEAVEARIRLLVGVGCFYNMVELAADFFSEGVFEVVADDENDSLEAGSCGVVDGVVDEGLVVRTDGFYLSGTVFGKVRTTAFVMFLRRPNAFPVKSVYTQVKVSE